MAYFREDYSYTNSGINKWINTHRILRDTTFKILSNQSSDKFEQGLALIVYKCLENFNKKKL